MSISRFRLLLITFWVGSLWTIGYLVAPTLFATLSDRVLAGTIAGRLFRVEAWVSVVCALILIGMSWRGKSGQGVDPQIGVSQAGKGRAVLWIALAMLACTLVGYFGLQPFMGALREAAQSGGMDEAARRQFGMLHGVASAFYLAQSVLGIALVWKQR
ncbi:DUF4149 domain-containing protein [Noviherbaspirillum galbum]|uniref:DUF4149 domain-containing protein n=1 Tax=Noviherbaspirillum galbum TaxID=2709383 RepID=A0A6B3SVE6_9BURK|nr:DUF4149 domain-containing protein [Noviherbaspirillum galbum]NEX61599.1 DUF4149 domain-containing protein [Noviherbaspirillum galbum]